MDYLDALAEFAHRTTFADLPPATVAHARHVLLDTLGAILGGSRLPPNARLARLLAERSTNGTATILGHGARVEPMFAALANGAAGVSLEVDEGSRFGGGHPAIHVVPALLAVAEETGADARRLLASLVVGYEITSRIGGATVVRPNVHSHGTWGTLGAAVAVAKLVGLDARALRAVVNLAASMSPANSWTPCFEGATIRNLYPGRSGLQGILAVHLQRCGFTALRDGPADIYGAILGERFDRARAVEGLGDEFRIDHNYFKFHACCLYNHPTLDAVAAIRRETGFAPADVAAVAVTSIPFAVRMVDPAPANPLAARFSIPYAVAASIVLGRTDVAAFDEAIVADPALRDLAARVEVRADPEMAMRRADYPAATVTVTLKDGRSLSRSTTIVRGDAANPVAPADLVAKFLALAGPTLGTPAARAVVDRIDRLEDVNDVRELTALLRPPP